MKPLTPVTGAPVADTDSQLSAQGRVWLKFHLKTQQGIRNLGDTEATAVVAQDRESAQRDLFSAIERGEVRAGRCRCSG